MLSRIGTPRRRNGASVARAGAAPALGDLDRLAGPGGLGGEVVEQRGRDVRLGQTELRQDAQEVGDDDALGPVERPCRRLDERLQHGIGRQLAGLEPHAHVARVVRPVGERHLVVGGVDRIDAVVGLGQVEGAAGVEQLGLDPAAQLDVGRRADPADGGDVVGHPVGARAHVVHAGQLGEPERLGLLDVALDRVRAVGERGVHVHVLARVHEAISAAWRCRSAMSSNAKKRSSK